MMTDAKKTDGEDDAQRYTVREATMLLQDWFSRKAVRLTKDNVSLIEDAIQEMSMGVLSCRGEHTLSYFRQQACFRVRDFLREERRHARGCARLQRMSLRVSEDGDEPFIEGLIDLESRMSTRAERMDRITDYYTETDTRETA